MSDRNRLHVQSGPAGAHAGPTRRLAPLRSTLALAAALAPLAGAPLPAVAQEPPGGEETRRSDEPLLVQLERAYAAAAERVAASVVAISVERDPSEPEPRAAETGENDAPYLKRPGGDVSGVAIAPDRVLTSAWNVERAKAIVVRDASGRRFAARVLGQDEALDVALLAVGAPLAEGERGAAEAPSGRPALAPTPVPERPLPRVGSWLVAVGRGPDGHLGVNAGIVSALGRFRGDALQTDAALNYGNYGGAAVDIEGRLLGICVRLSTRAGVNSGVGFVIPSERLRELLPVLERGERRAAPPRAFLGVQFGREILEPPGVEVARVLPGTAAADAGLEQGDVIRRIGDADAADTGSIADAIQGRRPGDTVRVEVDRAGRRIGFEVVLGTRPPEAR
jgi:serine protease Do